MVKFKAGQELRDGLEWVICTLTDAVGPGQSIQFMAPLDFDNQKHDQDLAFAELSKIARPMEEDDALKILARIAHKCRSPKGRAMSDRMTLHFVADYL